MITKVPYQDTALPTSTNSYTLFSTVVASPALRGAIQPACWHRFFLSVWHDENGTVVEEFSEDGGTTWRQQSSTAFTAGASANTAEYEIDAYRDWRLRWVNGGTDQTEFTVAMSLSEQAL